MHRKAIQPDSGEHAHDPAADDKGVNTLAAICAICKAQFAKILPYYSFPMDMLVSTHQLVGESLVMTGSEQEKELMEEEAASETKTETESPE